MTRATLTKKSALGTLGSAYTANAADLTMTAADPSNKNQFAASGKDLVIAWNSGATSHTVTITSILDDNGRTGNVQSYSLESGEYAVFGPFDLPGWCQTDWMIYLEANSAEVFFGAVDLSNF